MGGLAALWCILSVGSIVFLLNAIQTAGRNLGELQERTVFLEQSADTIRKEKETIGLFEAGVSAIQQRLLNIDDPRDVVKLLEETQKAGTIPGVSFSSQLGGVAADKSAVGMAITARGNFESVREVLWRLENFPYLSRIEDISFTRVEGREIQETDRAAGIQEGDVALSTRLVIAARGNP